MNVENLELSHLRDTYQTLKEHKTLVYKTPLLQGMECQLKGKIPAVKSLALKLESLQCTGELTHIELISLLQLS